MAWRINSELLSHPSFFVRWEPWVSTVLTPIFKLSPICLTLVHACMTIIRQRSCLTDRDNRIAKMKDGRTHLACKAEDAVDLASEAIVATTVTSPTSLTPWGQG
jgi:hypothetical protein